MKKETKNWREVHHFHVLQFFPSTEIAGRVIQLLSEQCQDALVTLQVLPQLPWRELLKQRLEGVEPTEIATRVKSVLQDYYHLLKDEDPWRISGMRI